MARPGSVQRIAAVTGTPVTMMHGAAALALTLFDHDTPLWLDPAMSATPDVERWLKFHTSAPIVADASISDFALIADPSALPALDSFAFGTPEYPDRSTTLILQVESLTDGPALELRGPGEFFGTRQAGMPSFQVANLIRDRQLLEAAKREAAAVLAGPNEEISKEEIDRALRHMRTHWQKTYGLVEVG